MESYDSIEVEDDIVTINGNPEPMIFDTLDEDGSLSLDLVPDLSHCPLCKSSIVKTGEWDYGVESDADISYCLWYCRRCRFWQYHHFAQDVNAKGLWGCPAGPTERAYTSKAREFDIVLPPTCSSEIAQYIKRNPGFWNEYNPHALEKLVADIFRANYAHSEVLHVGKPDDGGIDVLFVDSGNKQWLVQVKRRESQNSAEGVSTIRNMIGALMLENSLNGIIVSTADHFTLRAKQATEKIKSQGMHIVLIDKGKLDQMLDPVLPDRPWLQVLRGSDPEIAEALASTHPSEHQLLLFEPEDQQSH